jgi:hypothetical protein
LLYSQQDICDQKRTERKANTMTAPSTKATVTTFTDAKEAVWAKYPEILSGLSPIGGEQVDPEKGTWEITFEMSGGKEKTYTVTREGMVTP